MKRVIIIGASSGIGRQLALDFAQAGMKVGIAARRADKLREIAAKSPNHIVYKEIDVTAPDAAERFLELVEQNGGMDTLVFAAGVGFTNPDLDPALDRRIVDVNVTGFTAIVSAAYKYFRRCAPAQRARIAAITSVAGTKGIGIAAAYSASKRYQQTYLQALAQLARMQRVNLGITDIRPGFVRTDLLDPNRAYPMTMAVSYAAPRIERAIIKGSRVCVVDWRWSALTALWSLLPGWLWERMPVQLEK